MSLTPKAERTRALIVDTALHLFAERGYAATTMRDIAASADVSTGLAYRYFRRKEDLALALYGRLADDLVAAACGLEDAPLAQRYASLLHHKIRLMAPHRGALAALFAAALNPEDDVGVLSDATAPVRERVQHAMVLTVRGHVPVDKEAAMATRLYAVHLLVVLLWTQDRTADLRLVNGAIDLLRDGLTFALPLLGTPMAAPMLTRLDSLMGDLIAPKQA
ncbi:MAG: TetR/AcrR family transcriptional regulator [Myxococcota bacterium]